MQRNSYFTTTGGWEMSHTFNRILSAEIFNYTPGELLIIYRKVIASDFAGRNNFSFPAKAYHRKQRRISIKALAEDLRNLKALS